MTKRSINKKLSEELFEQARKIVQACEETGADSWEVANSYLALGTNMRLMLNRKAPQEGEAVKAKQFAEQFADGFYMGVEYTEKRMIELLDNIDFLHFLWVLNDQLLYNADAKVKAIAMIRATP